MNIVEPPPDWRTHPGWSPYLDLIAELAYGNPRYQFFDPDDFSPTAGFRRSGRPDIVELQHRYTRGAVSLDVAGHAYRFHPGSRGHGQFRKRASLAEGLDAVCLYLVPWTKPGFERYQFGWERDRAFALHPDQIRRLLSPPGVQDRWYLADDDDLYPPLHHNRYNPAPPSASSGPRTLRLIR